MEWARRPQMAPFATSPFYISRLKCAPPERKSRFLEVLATLSQSVTVDNNWHFRFSSRRPPLSQPLKTGVGNN